MARASSRDPHDRTEQAIVRSLGDPAMDAAAFTESFLRPPLFSTSYAHGFGTLYTAVYRVGEGVVEYRWPTFAWRLSFDAFHEASTSRCSRNRRSSAR